MKLRLLVDEIVKRLAGASVDAEKVARYTAALTAGDAAAVLAALSFLMREAVKYNVRVDVATNELQQLGLPKTHANALGRALGKQRDALRALFRTRTLALAHVGDDVAWRVDFVLASSALAEQNAAHVALRLGAGDASTAFVLDHDKLRVLLHELRHARALMDAL